MPDDPFFGTLQGMIIQKAVFTLDPLLRGSCTGGLLRLLLRHPGRSVWGESGCWAARCVRSIHWRPMGFVGFVSKHSRESRPGLVGFLRKR